MIKGFLITAVFLLFHLVVTVTSANTFESNVSLNLTEVTEWQVQLPRALEAQKSGAAFVDSFADFL